MLPFHEWKDHKRKEMYPLVKPRCWYWKEYSIYCENQRGQQMNIDKKLDKVYAFDYLNGFFVYRIPGYRHGDGQVDSDENPVWLVCDPEETPLELDWIDPSEPHYNY